MRLRTFLLAAACAGGFASPALADPQSLADALKGTVGDAAEQPTAEPAPAAEPVPLPPPPPARPRLAPRVDTWMPTAVPLTEVQRSAYRSAYAAIRAGEWTNAVTILETLPAGPLHAHLWAELFLAPGSPEVALPSVEALLRAAPWLPQAAQLQRLAVRRGAVDPPAVMVPAKLTWLGQAPRRGRAKSIAGDPAAAELAALMEPLIDGNRPAEAEALLGQREFLLTPAALTEWRQRVAWLYYISNMDADSRRLADRARADAGDWAVQASWVAGLACWRMNDRAAAEAAFNDVARRATDAELRSAGYYWAARAATAVGRPALVQPRLRAAARANETFYGMLAQAALGQAPAPPSPAPALPVGMDARPAFAAARALAGLGERRAADGVIRHAAALGTPADHRALIALAAQLDLAGTQFWLAHNGPAGASVHATARYPSPSWRPRSGWRVDRELAFAHALQESSFRTEVVSPAGAVGVMQVLPSTAGDMVRFRGVRANPAALTDPADNIDFGQAYLETLRDMGVTGGLLPKVIAAFNAGPTPVTRWAARLRDNGDPLLWIESIPYWETRGYVGTILRNYWVYQQQNGKATATAQALAEGKWPKFPSAAGEVAVRVAPAVTAGAIGGSAGGSN